MFADDGSEDATAIAMFADEHGSYVSSGVVDSHGRAHASLPQGGSVTILRIDSLSSPERDVLTTIQGVKPADHLVINSTFSPAHPPGTVDVMTASYTAPSATRPIATMSCGQVDFNDDLATATLSSYSSCAANTFDILAASYDGSTTSYLWLPELVHTPGGQVTLPDTWKPMGSVDVTLQNVPDGWAHAFSTYSSIIRNGALVTGGSTIDDPDATLHITLRTPLQDGTKARFVVDPGIIFGRIDLTAVVDPGTTALTFDLAQTGLPALGVSKLTKTGMVWSETNSGGGDVRMVYWMGSWTDGATSTAHEVQWTFMEDPRDGATSTTLPALPDSYAKQDATRQANLTVLDAGNLDVMYIDYDNIDGYDAARAYGPAFVLTDTSFLDVNHVVRRVWSK